MSEEQAVARSTKVNTKDSLVHDFKALGLHSGMTVIVHSSLSSIGWVCGGAATVVEALMEVVSSEGTLIMPTHSGDNSEPSKWENPPVPAEWWPVIRDTMPAFDPQVTPSRGMGKIVEVFRTYPGVIRSYHPSVSFAAWGKHEEKVTANHSLNYGLGEESPLARMYDLAGYVLLLGVGHDCNTSLHLAENRTTNRHISEEGAAIYENGTRVWKVYKDLVMDSDIFIEIGEAFEAVHPIHIGKIGIADARLFSQRECVDFGQNWLDARSEKV